MNYSSPISAKIAKFVTKIFYKNMKRISKGKLTHYITHTTSEHITHVVHRLKKDNPFLLDFINLYTQHLRDTNEIDEAQHARMLTIALMVADLCQ